MSRACPHPLAATSTAFPWVLKSGLILGFLIFLLGMAAAMDSQAQYASDSQALQSLDSDDDGAKPWETGGWSGMCSGLKDVKAIIACLEARPASGTGIGGGGASPLSPPSPELYEAPTIPLSPGGSVQ